MVSLRSYWRFVVVLRYFLPLVVAYLRDRHRFLVVGAGRSVDSETSRRRAEYLLESLLELGPTFIKLGQLLSTRPDVLPPEYVEVFSQLQDDVPPAEWSAVEAIITEDIGPVDERFDSFDRDAISGASLGQVYRAELDGDPVAVKVRRPGVETVVDSDLVAIRWAVVLLRWFLDDARAYSLSNLADEFEKTITQEMDYSREREMLEEIRGNFAENPDVVVPQSIPSHSSERVLTMEYISGIKVSNTAELERRGVDRSAVAETLARAYLNMVLTDGVFHADPHPGNLAIKDDGTIVFYDFGMSGRLEDPFRERITEMYAAIARQDIDAMIDVMIGMGVLSPEADRELIAEFIEVGIANARGESVDQYRVQRLIRQFQNSFYEFPFRLPRELALVMRVGSLTEGVCITLDPEFDFIDVITGYLTEEGYGQETAQRFASAAGQQVRDIGQSAVRIPPKLERALDRVERENLRVKIDIEDSTGRLERLTKRIVLGMVTTAGVLSTALLYTFTSVDATVVAGAGTAIVGWLLYRSFGTERDTEELPFEPEFGREQVKEYVPADGDIESTEE